MITSSKGKIHGDAYVTNYRLKFVPHSDPGFSKDVRLFSYLINSI